MSVSSSHFVGYASDLSGTNMASALLGLPVELLQIILSDLPFWQMVNMSQTCRRLRAVALGDPKLWQELPNVIVSQLRTLDPFLARSGKLGFDLDVSEISPCELTVLCPWLDANFSRLRKLCLEIEEPDDGSLNTNMLALLHGTLSSAAPLLEVLCLVGVDEEPFLGSLKPDILCGTTAKAPKLRKLRLTAFSLDIVCPGLQDATSVVASVGALSPKPTAAENLRVHALFPALRELEIVGVHVLKAGVDPNARPLARVPVIDQPLSWLKISWGPGWEREDVHAANWLATASTHVRNVEILTAQWVMVSHAILAPVVQTAHGMRVRANLDNDDEFGLELSLNDAQRERTALVRADVAPGLLTTLLHRADSLRLTSLVLETDARSLGLVAGAHGALNALPQLRVLRLDIIWNTVDASGVFIYSATLAALKPLTNVTCLHFCAPLPQPLFGIETARRIDARFLVHLLAMVFPNVRNAIVSIPLYRLSNSPLILGHQGCAVSYRPLLWCDESSPSPGISYDYYGDHLSL